MEENENLSITYLKNLNKQNFSSTLTLAVDANVNIKTILNISCYIFDEKIESASGKAVVSGKIGTKILYIDTDNMTNTLTDSQPFSETILDNSITNDCFINLTNVTILNDVISTEGNLKIGCNITFTPILYVNLGMKTNAINYENMVTKKSAITTNTIENKINTKFEYTTSLETRDAISKVLCSNSSFCPISAIAGDGYATVEGKVYTSLIYETTENEETTIKEITDCFNVKTDVDIPSLTKDSNLDLHFSMDKFNENITTDIDDGNSVITIVNCIKVCGVSLKEISVEVVEDMFSINNEIELTNSSRDFVSHTMLKSVTENVTNEISLNKEEPAIDYVVSNTNINPEITNIYIKNNNLYIEGIVTSTYIYLDENKEYKNKQLEFPFVVNTKFELERLHPNHANVSVVNCKTKTKRGTIIEVEYELNVDCYLYENSTKEIVDNVTMGKPLDFSQYDYQIYIAKPNETTWDLTKRIKCYPEDLTKYNKDLPTTFEGGEKIIIKR